MANKKNTETGETTTATPETTPEVTKDTPTPESSTETKDGTTATEGAPELKENTPEPETAATSKPPKAIVKQSKTELEMMDRLKVDKLYKNTKGEYFTSHNLASLSEGSNPKKVSEINRNTLELIVNGK